MNNKEITIPAPKIFESGKYFIDIADSLIHFRSLETNTKKKILKTLNMEVIIIYII